MDALSFVKASSGNEYVELCSNGESFRLVISGENGELEKVYIRAYKIDGQQKCISGDLEAQLIFAQGKTIKLDNEMTLYEAQEKIKLIKEEFERATCIEGRLIVKILSPR